MKIAQFPPAECCVAWFYSRNTHSNRKAFLNKGLYSPFVFPPIHKFARFIFQVIMEWIIYIKFADSENFMKNENISQGLTYLSHYSTYFALSFLSPLQSCNINSQRRLLQYLILLKGNIFVSQKISALLWLRNCSYKAWHC